LFGQFVKCLLETDYLIVTDIYAASEQPIEGVNAVGLVERIRALTRKPAVYLKKEEIISHLADIARPGDLIMTLGAGDITYLSDQLGEALRNAASAKVEKVSSGQ
jgi:UDP-N-acetylmuramate--alanine ligase